MSNHPLNNEINIFRNIILNSNDMLLENLKWNGANYSINGQDCISIRVQPVKKKRFKSFFIEVQKNKFNLNTKCLMMILVFWSEKKTIEQYLFLIVEVI
ncbi:MAG: hypothetical protein IE881_03980 [Epsilonproteobacteria bacterium]|nr:hypothetical protein [Campylobacterota bacterium]